MAQIKNYSEKYRLLQLLQSTIISDLSNSELLKVVKVAKIMKLKGRYRLKIVLNKQPLYLTVTNKLLFSYSKKIIKNKKRLKNKGINNYLSIREQYMAVVQIVRLGNLIKLLKRLNIPYDSKIFQNLN